MRMTRRRFVGCASGAAAALALPRGVLHASAAEPPECVLFDAGTRCLLRESYTGYATALTTLGVRWERRAAPFDDRPATIIVPMALVGSAEVAGFLMSRTARGSTVILEAAAAFVDSREAWLAEHLVLGEHMDVPIMGPEDLWRWRRPELPYLHFEWPIRASVRDFSVLTPLGIRRKEAIAIVHGAHAAAMARRVGEGRLVVLGSPLGATLRAEDREAHRWFAAMLGEGRGRAV